MGRVQDSHGIFLLFGCEPLLPLDQLIGVHDKTEVTHQKYAEEWKRHMEEAHKVAGLKLGKRKKMDRERLAKKPYFVITLKIQFLLHNLSEKHANKVVRWSLEAYY